MPDRALKIWLYLLLKVSYQDQPRWGIERGSGWISCEMIAEDCSEIREDGTVARMTKKSILAALRWLEEHGYITRITVRGKGQKISIPNYDKYQATELASSLCGSKGELAEALAAETCEAKATDVASSLKEPPREPPREPLREPIQEIKEIQEEERVSIADPFSVVTAAYHAHIGMVGPSQFEMLRHWYEDRGMPTDVIVEAILAAVEAGKRQSSYVEGILRNWHRAGIRTGEQAREARKPRSTSAYTPARMSADERVRIIEEARKRAEARLREARQA